MSPPVLITESGFLALILVGFVLPVTCLLGVLAYRFYAARSHRRVRREIAAYVAEGSITAADDERLMLAARSIPGAPPANCS